MDVEQRSSSDDSSSSSSSEYILTTVCRGGTPCSRNKPSASGSRSASDGRTGESTKITVGDELAQWVNVQHAQHNPVTNKPLREEAIRTYCVMHPNGQTSYFKASSTWITHLKKRFNKVLQASSAATSTMISARAASPVSVRGQAGQVAQNSSDRLGVSGMTAAAVGLIALTTTSKVASASAAVNEVDADRDPAMRMWMHTVNNQYNDMAQQVSQVTE